MAATVTTTEKFEKSIKKAEMDEQVRRRIKAGAIRSAYRDADDVWILETEWNMIGEQ
jgi:hypothetical protein